MFKIAILISGAQGRGSTVINLADACEDGRLPSTEITRVIGTVADSPALNRAHDRHLPTIVVPTKPSENYGARLLSAIQEADPYIICLAGYMRLVPTEVLTAYPKRIVNIHPALLPTFGGKGMYGHFVHEAVVAQGVAETGCTVHFIDGEYDTGPIILQRRVPVLEGDTPETVGARVLAAEHQAYPEALRMLAEEMGG